jgi:hypothetical protein
MKPHYTNTANPIDFPSSTMNERIQELIKQASYNIMETNGAPIISNEFNKEKFAELIVRECCDMVNKHLQHNNPNDCLLVLDIKEKFGVQQ